MTTYVDQANTGEDALVTTRSVTKPGGVASGDYAVFWLDRWHESGSFPAVTAPSGAVLRGTIATGNIQTLCYLLKVSAESSFAFSWTGSRWTALSALFFSGVDPALNLSTAPFHSATGTAATIGTTTVTTVTGAALAWNVNNLDGGTASHTPPTSFTEVSDFTFWASAYRISPGSGSQSAASATNSGSALYAAGLVALAPTASGEDHDLVCLASAGGMTLAPATHALTGIGQAHTASVATPAATAAHSSTPQAHAATAASVAASMAHSATPQANGATHTAATALHETASATQAHAAGGTTPAATHALNGAHSATAGATTTPATAAHLSAAVQAHAAGTSTPTGTRTVAGTAQADAAAASAGIMTGAGDIALSAGAVVAGHAQAAITHTIAANGQAHAASTAAPALTHLAQAAGEASLAAHSQPALTRVADLQALATAGTTARGTTGDAVEAVDDLTVAVGAPYSPWTAGMAEGSTWSAQAPHDAGWEVAAPS